MSIEVTSVSERRVLSVRRIALSLRQIFRLGQRGARLTTFRVILAVLVLAAVVVSDSFLRSYKYYSRVIDARLASGYLTSRPGLYAAPRTIREGQGFSQDDLVAVLRRAGYIEAASSDVWSGSFARQDSAVEIRPRQASQKIRPQIVRVSFQGGRVAGLVTNEVALESFTLEPEILTNDLSSKTGKRNTLSYGDIPPLLVQAIVSIEDRRFFEHPGLDVFGVARAMLRNAGDERIGQGGSTITQQLVKNTYLSSERTLRRKYAEAMLAFALEQRLSKQDILALYCNEVYLGQRGAVAARGVEQAARIYFGKELKNLSLSEAATIAGMIQGPSRYSPERKREAAQARRDLVLAAMTRDGSISAEQSVNASREPLVVVSMPDTYQSQAPYFIDYVNRVAGSQLEISGATQQIYTTIDLDLQQLAEVAIDRQLEHLNGVYKNRAVKPQAALVALDPHTGNVLAMVGGREYGESQLNRVTDAHRQPGSTFKPFVYAAALEDGFSPVQMFTDAPRDFVYDRNRIYRPSNFGGGYSGREVTMRTGLVNSLNIVTVDVAMHTGLARIANLASQFGLPKPERYPSLALGTTEATPLQLAAAYATFVNGGRRVEPKVIDSVSEPPGTGTDNKEQPQVISPTTAYMITNMLTAVVDQGTGRAARGAIKGTAIAGKTGTSRDGWFVGYTPNLVCVVWIGFDDNSQLGLTGATAALPAWTDFVKSAVALRPELGGRNFECPEGIEFVEIDADSGLISTLSCPHRQLIAVTDRLAPNFECYNHLNLPDFDGDHPPVMESFVDHSEVAQHRRAPPRESLVSIELKTLKSTRVDVDARGRRTLVNEMR
ncbi:MAG: PBP1A family penicillin-binding protein [Pyrinomonadaceae bacterium]|nr:PBP1A family penicillin-binding protein [Pyrinomonadaceae bacterium]